MTDLKIGDKVVMNDKYRVMPCNQNKVFEVVSKPYKNCGKLKVCLKDYGAYSCDGLSKADTVEEVNLSGSVITISRGSIYE